MNCRTFRTCLALLVLILGVIPLTGQQIDLPRKSPKASVSYQVGLTDVRITYSSPAVNNRKIWGDLVPYGEIWRAGANEATTIEFTTDVNLEGQNLPAGRYAFFVIPRPADMAWTAVFNKEADQWGPFRYDESKDVLRVDVKPTFNNGVQERLVYSIHDHDTDKGYIKLAWEEVRLYLRFQVNVLQHSMDNILTAIDDAPEEKQWIIYAQGANYLLESDQNIRQGLQWADMSTARKSSSWNWWIKAQLQARSGDLTSAIASATKSIELGEAAGMDAYYDRTKEEMHASLAEWKKTLGVDDADPVEANTGEHD